MDYSKIITAADKFEQAREAKLSQIRTQRNALLQQSDFSQLPDSPGDADAWAIYRQALRDITEQPGFPEVVDWPTKPE